MKIYKDDFKDLIKIHLIKDEIDRKETDNPFNRYGLNVLNSYIFNNIISLRIEIENMSINDIIELYNEIRSKQHIDNLKNYFPWLKFCQFLIEIIQQREKSILNAQLVEVDHQGYLNAISEYEQFTKLLNKGYNKLLSAYRWSMIRKYRPFQSLDLECKSPYLVSILEFGDYHLFFPSSYVLPVDYEEVRIQISRIEFAKNHLVSFSNTFSLLLKMVNKMQDTNKELEENKSILKQQERRSVEILGIFSAVALFSIGSIQIFNNEFIKDNPGMVYRFVLSFGFSLTLFIYLIWLITRENIKKIQVYHWVIFAFYALSLLLLIVLIVGDVK